MRGVRSESLRRPLPLLQPYSIIFPLSHPSIIHYPIMNSSQLRPQLNCPRGSKAVYACAKLQCTTNALMCQNTDCPCRQSHNQCLLAPQINNIFRKLLFKARCYDPLLAEIYNWYESQIKRIVKEMDALKILFDKKEHFLTGNERKLYCFIEAGNSEEITPELVHLVVDSIYKQPKFAVEETMSSVSETLHKSEQQLQEITEDLEQAAKTRFQVIPSRRSSFSSDTVSVGTSTSIHIPPSSPSMSLSHVKFSCNLHHSNISLINNHTIRVNAQNGNWFAALLEPSLFLRNSKRSIFKFRVNKTLDSCLMFGVCQITSGFKVTDHNIYNSIEYGSFAHVGSNSVWLGSTVGHRSEKTEIEQYETNDIVEVEFQRGRGKVTVRNLSKNRESVSLIKTDENFALYVGVIMYEREDQVEVIEVIESQ